MRTHVPTSGQPSRTSKSDTPRILHPATRRPSAVLAFCDRPHHANEVFLLGLQCQTKIAFGATMGVLRVGSTTFVLRYHFFTGFDDVAIALEHV